MDGLAAGTSLEMYAKLAEDAAADPDPRDDEEVHKLAEFEDDTGTGSQYTPFGSVYGPGSGEVRAVFDAAAAAVAPAVVSAAAGGTPTDIAEAMSTPVPTQKSNTTRYCGMSPVLHVVLLIPRSPPLSAALCLFPQLFLILMSWRC